MTTKITNLKKSNTSSQSAKNRKNISSQKTSRIVKPNIKKYKGYIEKSYRLVFEYPKVKPYPKTPPLLLTILENNIIEEVIKPLIKNKENISKGKSLICFNTPKTIGKLPTEHQVKTKIFLKINNFLLKELENKSKSLLTTELINSIKTKIPTKFPKSIGQEIEKQLLIMKGKSISKTLLIKIFREIKKAVSQILTKDMIQKLLDPFIWKEKDKNVLVHTWPVEFNQQFKKSFTISNKHITGSSIFNKEHFPLQSINNFKMTCNKLFGKNSVSSDNPIHLCYWKKEPIHCKVFQGLGRDLLKFLLDNKNIMKEFQISKVTNNSNNYSFTSIIEIKGKTSGDKTFHINPNINYILYIKFGYQKMAMMTPSKDFLMSNELIK